MNHSITAITRKLQLQLSTCNDLAQGIEYSQQAYDALQALLPCQVTSDMMQILWDRLEQMDNMLHNM